MKKQLSVFALAAASVAIGMTGAQAQAPLPSTSFDPNTYRVTGVTNNAEVITVYGDIPEFIEFTAVDNAIELGDIGGPLWNSAVQGPVRSVQGRSNNGNTGPGFSGVDFAKSTDTAAGQGDAKIEFRANTYIRVKFSGGDLTNTGPDAAPGGGDDYILPTSYRFSVKGKVQFASDDTGTGSYVPFPGNTGQNPVPPGYEGDYAHYSAPVVAANNTAPTPNINFTYAPGAPTYTGVTGPTPNTDPNAPSGFRFMAEVERHGLNDYRGAYSTTLNLTYFKY